MADPEREEYLPDPTVKFKWRINLRQLNKITDALGGYDQLIRMRQDEEGLSLPPECVVFFIDTLEEFPLSIYIAQTSRKGKFDLIASRGVLPIIRDVFGSKFPHGEEVFE